LYTLPDIPCDERARLEHAVMIAVLVRCDTKPEERGPARIAEIDAVKALDEHVALHGCVGRRKQKKS
jgi:hypothetical protein